MAMADGRYYLDRIALEIQEAGTTVAVYKFAVNPQQIQDTTPSRTYVQETATAGTVQRFGAGVESFTITGTTGWRHGKGYDEINQLKEFVGSYMNEFSDNIAKDYTFLFHNYTQGYDYVVDFAQEGISFSQDVAKPLFTNYTLQLIVVRQADQASSGEISNTTLGNDASSLGGGTSSNGYVNPNVSTKATSLAYNQISSSLGS